MRILRSVLAVLAGTVAGGIVVAGVEALGHAVYPLPEGLDPTDTEALAAAMAEAPAGALVFVLAAWAVGSFAGGWLAAWIAGRAAVVHALIVGAILMAGGIWVMTVLPHPRWFRAIGIVLFLPGAWLGAAVAPPRSA